jgi:pimeloyl-ACP methyl ester carboxylesterase
MSARPGPHVAERVGQFFLGDDRLEYTELGGGGREDDRWVVLVHGQLMPRSMHLPLARVLASHGNHVVLLDLLGHGGSDRPEDPREYSMTAFAEQVVGLLDHLGVDRAVVGGTSLGANVSLEVAVLAPDRVQGLLLEMPVLDNAVEAGILAFAPLLFLARLAPVAVRAVAASSRLVPRRLAPHWGRVVLDTLDQQPGPMAATIHGLFFGRVAPPARLRRTLPHPAMVVGHPRDPIHLAADARMVAEELERASYVEASSILEWRLRPERLTRRTVDFLDEAFAWSAPARGHLEEVGGAVLP